MIVVIAIYTISRIESVGAVDAEREALRVHNLIEKALIQSYALYGAYPTESEFEEKMDKYGVFLNKDKFIFHYHAFASNIMPEFFVIPRVC